MVIICFGRTLLVHIMLVNSGSLKYQFCTKDQNEYCLNKMDPDVAELYARDTSVRLGKIAFNNVVEKKE